MPLPLISIIPALSAGGVLVPHAAGGMIVTTVTGTGYIAGTYLSTFAIGSIITAAATAFGASAIFASLAVACLIGGAGIFGTTIGATGITGALMSAGLIASTPLWIPVVIGVAILGGAGALYFTGALEVIIGGAGIFGTTIGATGITGFLMRGGILSSTHVWVAVLAGLTMLVGASGICYLAYRFYKLKQKIKAANNVEEIQFTEKEAWFIEKSIKYLSKTTTFFRRMKRLVSKITWNFRYRNGFPDKGQ
jgi:hypothetical protein